MVKSERKEELALKWWKKVKNFFAKWYYIPGVDHLNQLVETPASKERTDFRRFLITAILTAISALAAIVAAVAAVLTYIKT